MILEHISCHTDYSVVHACRVTAIIVTLANGKQKAIQFKHPMTITGAANLLRLLADELETVGERS